MQELVTDEQFRENVKQRNADSLKRRKEILTDRLHAQPLEHPERLFYILESLSQNALELGMLDWREGIDPTAQLSQIKSSFEKALEVRPDILPNNKNPDFMAIVSSMMGWDLPFDTAPPRNDEIKFEMNWLDRWMIAGLHDSSCWPLKANAPVPKNRFINQCLDDYWSLLTDQVDPKEGMQRCIDNYDRRATHATFKSLPTYLGGGAYNGLFIDYTLAAIMKKRGLVSNSVHDWVWG